MSTRWDEDKISYLKENYNKSYEELSASLGRTKRAIKHMVGVLGLKRDERRKWTAEELDILSSYNHYSPADFISKGLINRSEFQIAKKLVMLRGSANRRLKDGWSRPSIDLAYFLGCICSDMGVYEYRCSIVQKISNKEMIFEIKRVVESILGLPYKEYPVFIDEVRYNVLDIYTTEILKNFGTKEGIESKNIRGPNGEWIDFIEQNFSWVFDDKYFWHFIGGLYDGDGSLIRHKNDRVNGGIWYEISIAIKPKRSLDRIWLELEKRGFNFKPRSWDKNGNVLDIGIRGGQSCVDNFLELVQCKITRKKKKF